MVSVRQLIAVVQPVLAQELVPKLVAVVQQVAESGRSELGLGQLVAGPELERLVLELAAAPRRHYLLQRPVRDGHRLALLPVLAHL